MLRRWGSRLPSSSRAPPTARTSRRWPRRSSRSRQRGHTYQSDGSVYFKISTFPEYGRLARLDHSGIKSGARVDSDKYEKDDARDFVLWKASKPGEPVWDAGFGAGRPGWHIECSAMALRLLGAPIDLHAGGVDLIFPHHENEIAQSEGATGQTFARFWMHVEHLMVEEDAGRTDKMSKSLGNVFNLSDIVEQGYRPSALRYLYLGVHYRKQLKFSWTAMSQAEESLKRLTDFLARLDTLPAGPQHDQVTKRLAEARDAFRGHIAADLNTAAGIGVMFDLVRALNSSIDSGELSQADAAVDPRDVRRIRSGARSAVAPEAGGRAAACADSGDRASDRGPPRGAARAQLRRSRSHPQGPRRPRHHARGFRGGHEVEEEVGN